MPIKSSIATSALVALALTVAAVTTQPAAAGELHIDGGMIDGILNNALAANRSYYGTGDPRCPLVHTSDYYGHYVGWVHTCMLPPTISHGVLQLRSPRLIVGDEDRRAARW
ncbi:hypothetical protein UP10_01365 [Bradyrhizobium sp. LTSPM299]|jgi:hypothetical protein|uniref:hypothetical protein n=1 Tax=Bradyrhizobium sp. LTSPM299 TaxID=1619233 RepID=UPI0005C81662|nr:hypothetical protein [Bradyrhizobium sp. LTSPM299]KJC62064.1 hypothetical protein UP10_01365 [Bradyrhizobium sp. LTSPM299]